MDASKLDNHNIHSRWSLIGAWCTEHRAPYANEIIITYEENRNGDLRRDGRVAVRRAASRRVDAIEINLI